MSDPLNWDEFRLVRAIAAAQSLSGAAERLGLNHSTLFRRLAAVEARLGVKLFERERSGYRTTAAGEDMVALATLMGDTIAEFERRVARNEVQFAGRVRLATRHSLGVLVMPAISAALSAAHPALHLELILTESAVDLERGEADIAARCLKGPPPDCLVGRRIARLPWAIYAAAPLAEAAGEDPARLAWVAPSDSFAPTQARDWVERHVDPCRRAATVSSDIAMAGLAARGVGAALLPCFVAAAKPELRMIAKGDPELESDLWLLANERALRTPRLRAAFDFLAGELERRRAWFAGEAAAGA
jgi:DNA-binding transcriptional LysR family regulator